MTRYRDRLNAGEFKPKPKPKTEKAKTEQHVTAGTTISADIGTEPKQPK